MPFTLALLIAVPLALLVNWWWLASSLEARLRDRHFDVYFELKSFDDSYRPDPWYENTTDDMDAYHKPLFPTLGFVLRARDEALHDAVVSELSRRMRWVFYLVMADLFLLFFYLLRQ